MHYGNEHGERGMMHLMTTMKEMEGNQVGAMDMIQRITSP